MWRNHRRRQRFLKEIRRQPYREIGGKLAEVAGWTEGFTVFSYPLYVL
ncbi:MAG: hypothetical protein ACYDG6_05280 [Thermincolia bacterium]